MSSALTIFFRNLEYDWKEEEDNQQRDNGKDHSSKNHQLLFMPEQVTNDGSNERANDRDDDANTEEDSSSTSSDTSSSTTSTTKSVPLSAFHIQIVSDNASSNCSQNQSHSAGNQSIRQGLLLPKRRHSTPARPSPNDCGPRRPRNPGYSRSSSSGSLLVYHLPSQKHSSWKTFDLYEKDHGDFFHYDSALAPPSSSSCSPHFRVGGGSSCSSRLTSRWHSGDQLLPAQTKSPLVQPIRRNTSRDDILVQSSPDSNDDDDVCGAGGKSTLHTFARCQCSKHSHNNNNDLAGMLSASSSSSLCHPVGGSGNVRSDKFAL